ncbi:MAG TPA: AMP-binding protein [Candidatus Aminicenantes bacterium]|nr:AMP-binding protein [Candidatus Aminicenantes bacterium]
MGHTRFVHSFLEDSADRFADKKALFASGTWHSYRDLNARANRLARLLLSLGLKRGDRAALFIENSPEYVVSYYAILKAGGTTVALNTELTAADVAYISKDCGVRFLIAGRRLAAKTFGTAPAGSSAELPDAGPLPENLLVWKEPKDPDPAFGGRAAIGLPGSFEGFPDGDPGVRVIDIDNASIVYTSGSTGRPRGAVLTHLNIVSNTRSIVDYLELTQDDRIMVVLPFHYIYGKSLLNTHFYVGGSVVIDNRFLYPNAVLQTMREQDATGFAGVPSTFTILLSRSNLKAMTFPKLRYVTQAGGAMAPAVQKEVVEAFAPAPLFVMYGATEASARLSYLDPRELHRKWGSIGKAIANVDLFVADGQGRPLPAGEEGEIVARGSNLMSGYWNHPEETEKVLKNGLYFTGDIGRMDEEGFLYVVGRTKDMIKIGGNRVSAKEIEEALHEHPGIVEAAVVGVPDEVLGEAPKAILVVKKEAADGILEELPSFLQKRLAVYKIPKNYEIRDSLPKNEAGKVLKLKLR